MRGTFADSPPDVSPVARSTRWQAAAMAGLVFALYVIAQALQWRYLYDEHLRYEAVPTTLMLVDDVAGLSWLAIFTYRHVWQGRPLIDRPVEHASLWLAWAPGVSVAAALGITVLASYDLMRRERDGYGRAVRVDGMVVSVDMSPAPATQCYTVRYRYIDGAGTLHHGVRRIFYYRVGYFTPPISIALRSQLISNTVPFDTPIVYDPVWPARSWLANTDWNDHKGIAWIGMSVALFEGLIVGSLALIAWLDIRQGKWGWWIDGLQVAPLLIKSALLLMMSAF